MTPQARLSAAIFVLDRILSGDVAEKALTNWGRASRFAGSGDRLAVRDLVFDALRCKRSFAALGGGETGRGLILGGLRDRGIDPAEMFTGIAHAPAVIGPNDVGVAASDLAQLDCPDWLAPHLCAALGDNFVPVLQAMRHRAAVFLRVNLAKTTLQNAQAALRHDGIATRPVPGVKTALEAIENARKIQTSAAYLAGLVELQDASSQAVVQLLPLHANMKVLDYCAGGGGKTLAMAAVAKLRLFAYDVQPRRMQDLPARATRAAATIIIVENPEKSAPYDLILTDVPCSGSGSWRRDPQGKWALTPDRLAALIALQTTIIDRAAALLGPCATLAYVTCSMLHAENEAQVAGFLARHPDFRATLQRRFSPLSGGDGFFVALLTRES